jgi:Calcineurin-like phosphoesterase
MYDLIGDIHGYADELVELLETLGYQKSQGTYRHPERKVIFLGDFIDRGPKILQVLGIVRPMGRKGDIVHFALLYYAVYGAVLGHILERE